MRLVSLILLLSCIGCSGSAGDGTPGNEADTSLCATGMPERERHGGDCLCCHSGEFSVAGSTLPSAEIQRVIVRDANGLILVMPVDPYDNFFQHTAVAPPLRASIVDARGRERIMQMLAPRGSCNACHADGTALGLVGAP